MAHVRLETAISAPIARGLDRPHRFVAEQVSGPFRSFRHEHTFESIPGGTRRVDAWYHVAPFGIVGRATDWLILGRLQRRLLETRHAALKREAEAEGGVAGS